jgi:hypothetical protein
VSKLKIRKKLFLRLKMKFIFTLRTSDDKLTRLLVVDRLRPFINDDDADADDV